MHRARRSSTSTAPLNWAAPAIAKPRSIKMKYILLNSYQFCKFKNWSHFWGENSKKNKKLIIILALKFKLQIFQLLIFEICKYFSIFNFQLQYFWWFLRIRAKRASKFRLFLSKSLILQLFGAKSKQGCKRSEHLSFVYFWSGRQW